MPLPQVLAMAESLPSPEAMPTALCTAPCCSGSSGTGTYPHSEGRVVNWPSASPYSHKDRHSAILTLSAAVVTAFLVGQIPPHLVPPEVANSSCPFLNHSHPHSP